jgi:hypothetical protein
MSVKYVFEVVTADKDNIDSIWDRFNVVTRTFDNAVKTATKKLDDNEVLVSVTRKDKVGR